MRVGIDVSRGRSGGAITHILGVLSELEPEKWKIDEVHVWAHSSLLALIPSRPWLKAHSPSQVNGSLWSQVLWQRFKLKKELNFFGCDILLSTDAGTAYVHTPSVVMSRDMLSFEAKEMNRYRFSLAWLRLYLLRYLQTASLRKATGALFLTDYASKTIQSFTGPLTNYRIIPHGISDAFRRYPRQKNWPDSGREPIRCLYVSNTAAYKHQWNVVEAIANLRNEGYLVEIEFAGGGSGPSLAKLKAAIRELDPEKTFTEITGRLPHDKLPSKLSNADLFIFASSCENMPNTLVEAMASGLPIACSSSGPMPEVLRDAGTYFDPESPQSIGAAVKQLLDSPQLRLESSENAAKYSTEYSWRRCADETFRFLCDTLDSYRKSRIK
jgi:glycosyltransferase involved in cell wall biosynthesis